MDQLEIAQRLGAGHLIEDMALALLNVAEEVAATGNKGTVTVTFTVTNFDEAPGPRIVVSEAIKRAPPVPNAHGTLFWSVGDGELHENDPRQMRMDLREPFGVDDQVRAVLENVAPPREVGGE